MTIKPSTLLEALRVSSAATVGPVIRARRRAQSLRIDDAAALSGVSVDLLSRLENGKGSVRLDKLLAVLDGLGLVLVVGAKDGPWLQSLHVHLAENLSTDKAAARSQASSMGAGLSADNQETAAQASVQPVPGAGPGPSGP